MYCNGFGTAVDYNEALLWLKKAFDGGYSIAAIGIGDIYNANKKHTIQALNWYMKAIEKGETGAVFYKIGSIYTEGGYGVKQDLQLALDWFTKGADRADSQFGIGTLCHVYFEQPDYGEAMFWYRKADENNHAVAQNNIGRLYEKGLGIKQEYVEAMKWYVKASENGCATATANIGWFYHHGLGVQLDYFKALMMYQKAVDLNSLDCGYALSRIGLLYQNGLGVTQSYTKAIEYFLKAADMECDEAFCSLGDIYKNGYGVDKNYEEVIKWYSKSAENALEKGEGQFNLGLMHLNGLGTNVNYDVALFWMEKSLKNGIKKAQNYIDQINQLKKIPKIVTQSNNITSNNLTSTEELADIIENVQLQEKTNNVAAKKPERKLEALMTQLKSLYNIQQTKYSTEDEVVSSNTTGNLDETKDVKAGTPEKEQKKFFHLESNITSAVVTKDPIKFFHVEDTSSSVDKTTNEKKQNEPIKFFHL